MSEPLGYFLTWSTYGTWLPGDGRGWIEHCEGWQAPDPVRKLRANELMKEEPCLLHEAQRSTVEAQVAETCKHRGWLLHAVNCRSNHIHIVVEAPETKCRKARIDLKSWTTRCLKQKFDGTRENWWAERGYTCLLKSQTCLDAAIIYTLEAQDYKF